MEPSWLRALLKARAGPRTLVMTAGAKGGMLSYVCGACGEVGSLPPGPTPGKLTCSACGATLRPEKPQLAERVGRGCWLRRSACWRCPRAPTSACCAIAHAAADPDQRCASAERCPRSTRSDTSVATPPAAGQGADAQSDAITQRRGDDRCSTTRGAVPRRAVAEIWNAVRTGWRYVNDPEGQEYSTTATRPSERQVRRRFRRLCGCTLASMVSAISGKARVIIMDGPRRGHAYAEACVRVSQPRSRPR